MKKHNIIISGGGTGGHIFPAVAIAKSIEQKISNVNFLFVGAKDRMEMNKIPALGYKITGLWISGFQRKLTFRNIIFPLKLIYSLFQALYVVYKFKPTLVIGTGGYASGPILFIASKFKIPCLVQEQNSYPGITNRILGKYVDKVCVAYDNMDKFFIKEKIFFTGNPIREDILECKDEIPTDINNFFVRNQDPAILVIGGSLGAKTINQAISNNIDILKEKKINIIWQTGLSYYSEALRLVKESKAKNIKVFDFIKKMDKAYTMADIIVSRAGAIAISELCCIGKPVILIPSPNVAENHQYKNAQSLVNKKAAILVEDKEAICKLVNVVLELLENKLLKKELSKNIRSLAIIDASFTIADIALSLIKK